MNEILFASHILIIVLFLLIALRLGKNYLLALVALLAILANLFVIKQIDLFTKVVTSTDAYIVGAVLGQNLLQEYFGKKTSLKAIKITFFSMIFFLIMAKVHLLYIPSIFDNTQTSFQNILTNSPRIIISSITVFFIASRFDVIFFGFLKKIFKDKHLVFRMTLSSILTQLLDTILFTYLALFGQAKSILDIILFSFIIKSLVIFIAAPFMKFSKTFFKKINYE
ncbi:MAG: hypothetical protein K940chlam1_00246 [Candidatus Anoxychlamydiales bacterium]|nr:hypothetical protein [Candidatus Anoxychlamydiales bacterium]NGX35694.1 hypothetical protein [Candidatus Anoxychlamydiales bacterium]